MSASLLFSPPALRTSSDRSSSLNRAPPLLHIGTFSACQNLTKSPLLKSRRQSPHLPCSGRWLPYPHSSGLNIPPAVEVLAVDQGILPSGYYRDNSLSCQSRLFPPAEDNSSLGEVKQQLSEPSHEISPLRKTFLPCAKVTPLGGFSSSESITSLSPLSPLTPNFPTFPHCVASLDTSSFSQPPSSLKKSQSTLIMPSLFTFLRQETGGSREESSRLPRDISSRSLNDTATPSQLIRKCHTVIALSSPQSSPPHTLTKVTRERPRFGFLRCISPPKSAVLSTSSRSTSNSQGQPLRKSPSTSFSLQRYRKTSPPSMWPHAEHPGEEIISEIPVKDLPLEIITDLSDGDTNNDGDKPWNAVAGCSRCTSVASLASRRLSAVGSEGVFCKLCLTDVSIRETYQLHQCHCRFCTYCMCMYTTLKIREGEAVIECPDSNCDCRGELCTEEIESLVGKELLSLHLKFKEDREVDLDPFRTWCPRPGCETVVSLSVSKLDGRPQCSLCPTCKASFCASCALPWHPGRPCLRNVAHCEVPLNDSIKRCPRCKVPIERDAGCAQMQCKKCKHVFCWYCLASLEDDFLLRHYDKGPCKNKLGHSRASVLLHRAQVVVIFAGFGLLLVIASPILLLIGPCLFCRSCRHCSRSEHEDEVSSV